MGPFGGETIIAGVVAAALALAGLSTIRKQSRPEATDKQAPNFKGVDRMGFDGVMTPVYVDALIGVTLRVAAGAGLRDQRSPSGTFSRSR